MGRLVRVSLAGGCCLALALAAGVWYWISHPDLTSRRAADPLRSADGVGKPGQSDQTGNSRGGGLPGFDINPGRFEDGGFTLASQFMAPVSDPGSLKELRAALSMRGKRGIAALKERYERLRLDAPPTPAQVKEKAELEQSLGQLFMYEGDFAQATTYYERALEASQTYDSLANTRQGLMAILGIVALRRAEVDNGLGKGIPSNGIFPIGPEAVYKNQTAAREAVGLFKDYLAASPRDLRIVWLLNLAEMTLGEHPDKVPPRFLLPTEAFRSKLDVGRFENVAIRAGLTVRGTNLAGGSIFDDFTGDGLPDLFTSSLDADKPASFFVNKGDGTFVDRSAKAGLDDQVYALNIRGCDYNNDGRLDVLMLRGGWESPMRMSLLKNRGDGTFEDVTRASGLIVPLTSETAAWGDYDNDGWPDLFVGAEWVPPPGVPLPPHPDPRNHSRLYHNKGDGTFVDVAAEAGVTNDRCSKGCAWGDYDGDGRLDLLVSNMGNPCRLYHNEGNGHFRDVAPELAISGPEVSFACWFWDFDNDGRLDLYFNDYRASVSECVVSAMGSSLAGGSRPRLYRNLGKDGFREVSREVGLDRAIAPMGVNFGDIDNDGFLDIYYGTGDMSYGGLDRNLLFKNVEGRQFVDITASSGTGHIQKGHGVSFADFDGDGNLDFFAEMGGATPGDSAYNLLFRNPGHGRHWLQVKLVGTRTNRAALGARIRVDATGSDGRTRSVYRTVGNNASFGGNSLVESIGLLDATRVATLTVSWPTSQTTQTFRDLPADRAIVITEGSPEIRPLR